MMSHGEQKMRRQYLGAFIGVVFGSVGWMLTLMYRVQGTAVGTELSILVGGVVAVVCVADVFVWRWASGTVQVTKWRLFGAVCGATLASSIGAVTLEYFGRPLLTQAGIRDVESLYWIPLIAAGALCFVLFQFVVVRRTDSPEAKRGRTTSS